MDAFLYDEWIEEHGEHVRCVVIKAYTAQGLTSTFNNCHMITAWTDFPMVPTWKRCLPSLEAPTHDVVFIKADSEDSIVEGTNALREKFDVVHIVDNPVTVFRLRMAEIEER
jgi:hypothetical protein